MAWNGIQVANLPRKSSTGRSVSGQSGPEYSFAICWVRPKVGKVCSTPVNLHEVNGKQFLVVPRPDAGVRNAEVCGEVTLKKRGRRRTYAAAAADSERRRFEIVSSALRKHGPEVFQLSLRRRWKRLRNCGGLSGV
jgi:hypothetical protein